MTGWIAAALALPPLALAWHLFRFQRWYARETEGDAYFARPAAARDAFRGELRRRSRLAVRLAALAARLRPPRRLPGTRLRDVAGPPHCRGAFARAAAYRPRAGDVFVATQMKCGTTWMQQIAYEVLSRGRGDLSDAGHRHLYALSPWIEARYAVPLDAAPRIGEAKARLVKTHLPTSLCPWGEEARYLYVTRHPVACFASCVDFVSMLLGPLTPALPDLLDWFCSDRMWWRSWPEHVDGWWRWAQERPNVLFLHYEELLADLPAAVDRVASFLDTPLAAAERAAVVERSGFAYMKRHEERFEMAPPTPFSVGGEASFLRSGRRDREHALGPAERERILAFCRERLRGAAYPAARFYPELA
jgi:hypothetical protein